MTDDNDLVKRLRGWARDIQEGSTAIYAMDLDLKAAANRIETLTEQLEAARADADEAEAYAEQLAKERDQALDAVRDATAKLSVLTVAMNVAILRLEKPHNGNMDILVDHAEEAIHLLRYTLSKFEGDKQ